MSFAGDIGEAIEALNMGGGFANFWRDSLTILGASGAGAVTAAGATALLGKTRVGAWLGRAQAPALIAGGVVLGPVAGLLHPTVGVGVGVALATMGITGLLNRLLKLPMPQADEEAEVTTDGFGTVFATSSGGRGSLGRGDYARIRRELLGMGVVNPVVGDRDQMGVVNPTAGDAPQRFSSLFA